MCVLGWGVWVWVSTSCGGVGSANSATYVHLGEGQALSGEALLVREEVVLYLSWKRVAEVSACRYG